MGMSHDFEVAIEEGATMVRVGSAIFGDARRVHDSAAEPRSRLSQPRVAEADSRA